MCNRLDDLARATREERPGDIKALVVATLRIVGSFALAWPPVTRALSPPDPNEFEAAGPTGEPRRPSSSTGRSLGVGRPLQLERVQEVQVAR
jgi:hypothetical protein